MVNIEKLEEQFKLKQTEANEIAIKIALVRQGIDPVTVSRQDFDRVMRINTTIFDIREKANMQINKINQDASQEHNKLVMKIQEALSRYRPNAQITPVPEVTSTEPHPLIEKENKQLTTIEAV